MSRPVYSIPRSQRVVRLGDDTRDPGAYDPKLAFARPALPAFSFARDRRNGNKPSAVPGPGNYDGQGKISRKAPAFTFSSKQAAQHKENVPGPGNYNPALDFNASTVSYSMPKDKRCALGAAANAPGPGHYDARVESVLSAQPQFSFGNGLRGQRLVHDVPGPGAYQPAAVDRVVGGQMPKEQKKPEHSAVPGPGAYDNCASSVVLRTNPGVSMRFAKKADAPRSEAPGPGVYDPCVDQARARPTSVKFGKQPRRADDAVDVPGPGAYDPRKETASAAAAVFGTGAAHKFVDANANPGPGTYCPAPGVGAGTKQVQYSFPKAENKSAPSLVVGPGAYNPNHDVVFANNARAGAVFGSQRRADGAARSDVPGPGNYDPLTKNLRASTSWGFGSERRDRHLPRPGSPGPGAYETRSAFDPTTAAKKGPRLRSRPGSAAPSAVPGPGAYNGRLDFARPQSPQVKFPHSDRFRAAATNPVGPGQYEPGLLTRSAVNVRFGCDARFGHAVKSAVPGPGAYNGEALKSSIQYSLRPKTASEKPSNVPGPGAYDPVSRDHTPLGAFDHNPRKTVGRPESAIGPGAYDPRLQDARPKWSFGKEARGKDDAADTPGPGAYQHVGFTKDHPSYVLSNMQFKA